MKKAKDTDYGDVISVCFVTDQPTEQSTEKARRRKDTIRSRRKLHEHGKNTREH